MSLAARIDTSRGGFRPTSATALPTTGDGAGTTFHLTAEVEVRDGEVVAILGPNGAGKTTLLRAIAGLSPLDAGAITLDGRVLDDPARGVLVPPEERPLGVVFQDYLLFPHLDAADNVAFGLRCRGLPRRAARTRAAEWLARVGLAGRERARPGHLSGGQQQRVALARALAIEPRVLLLDEPLSALDVETRGELRRTLRGLLDGFAGIRLLVTHDPLEARALADRLVILEDGRVVQSGTPEEVTAQPRSAFASRLAGVNLLRGRADDDVVVLDDGSTVFAAGTGTGDVFLVIHPTAIALHRTHPEGTPRNVWQAEIEGLEPHEGRVRVRLRGAHALVAEVTPRAVAELKLDQRGAVWASVKATEILRYPA